MKFCTPHISWHDRQPILSVDIQNRPLSKPIGESKWYRVATGGNDFHVNVWKINLSPNESSKLKPNIECLAELTQPQRGVNVVRFSPSTDEDYLAAGDDDAHIFIWKLCENDENDETEKSSITSDIIAVERWKLHKILRGHTQDVLDLSWSIDGKFILSGSVDNNVYVWDVSKGTRLKKFNKNHSGYVQGVAWDPLNKYIVSLSTDRQMIVVDFNKCRVIHRVTKLITGDDKSNSENNGDEANGGNNKNSGRLFFDHSSMTYFRRLNFTPGGELLLAPSGIFETGADKFIDVLYMFERDSLNRPSFHLPTKSYALVVRCCPIAFELRQNIANPFKFSYRYVFAVGTKKSVLFYDTQQLSPFAHVSQIHYMSISDIAWSPDGRMIIITSNDGFATFVHFDEGELGTPYSGELMSLEDLQPVNNVVAKAEPKNKPPSTPKVEVVKMKPKAATPITSFFKKTSSPSNENVVPLDGNNPPSSKPPQAGRRVSLITLFKPCKKEEEEGKPLGEANLKRKLSQFEEEEMEVIEPEKADNCQPLL